MFKYSNDNKRYHTLSYENRKIYGEKVWKIAVDGGFTCPNIDGTAGFGGCIFCENGSGYFVNSGVSIEKQIEAETVRLHKKDENIKIIVYFQKNTNTYGNDDYLKKIYNKAINMPYVVGLSIGTRADCLSDDVIDLLKKINAKTHLTVELGMQSSNDDTNKICNRGYSHETFVAGFNKLKENKIRTCIHIINGLPNENFGDMLNTAKEVNRLNPDGIKIQSMHVIKGTVLEKMYLSGKYKPIDRDFYVRTVCNQLEYLNPEITIERITGDGDKTKLVAPKWSSDKKKVIAAIDKYMAEHDIYQGDKE